MGALLVPSSHAQTRVYVSFFSKLVVFRVLPIAIAQRR